MSYNRSRKRKYVKNACTNCRAAHASCTNKKACRRCVKLNLVCTVENSKKRRKTEVTTTPKVPLVLIQEVHPSSPSLPDVPLRETALCFTGTAPKSPVPLLPKAGDTQAREQLNASRKALEKMDQTYLQLLAQIEEKQREITSLTGDYSPVQSAPSSPTVSSPLSSPYSSHMPTSDPWNTGSTSLLPLPAGESSCNPYDLMSAATPYLPHSPDASSTSATDDEDDTDMMSSSWDLDSTFKKDLTCEPAFSSSFLPDTGFDIWQQAVCF